MISDVLSDAIFAIEKYLKDKLYDNWYTYETKQKIKTVIKLMNCLRRELDSSEINKNVLVINEIYKSIDILTERINNLLNNDKGEEETINANEIMEEEAYQKGFNNGIDADWSWVQCAITKLINKGEIKDKEIINKIFNACEELTAEEFDQWETEEKIKGKKSFNCSFNNFINLTKFCITKKLIKTFVKTLHIDLKKHFSYIYKIVQADLIDKSLNEKDIEEIYHKIVDILTEIFAEKEIEIEEIENKLKTNLLIIQMKLIEFLYNKELIDEFTITIEKKEHLNDFLKLYNDLLKDWEILTENEWNLNNNNRGFKR